MSKEGAERLAEAKREARRSILPLSGVRGVGIGDGTIRVYVRDATAAVQLPDEVDGVPVEAVVVGDIAVTE